ncbi:MAG TPA: PAS domain S-box protein, partial [Chitinophagaceae bacterium]|nr:PAS domain S-box protein [Chitinophagaceae bacterium]
MLTETQQEKPFSFLQGGGEMGHRIRNFDWSKTPLGTPDTWDSSLKTCVRIMLTSPQPMFVWWGDELINIYNDAYRFVLGNKHPQMLGISGKIVWKEIWSELWKRAEIVFTKNEGTFDDALLLVMNRYGYDEETYFKFSYNPVPGDEGGTKGLFCACTEETQRIINERSLATLREVGAMTFEEKSLDVIYHNVADALGKNNKDFPFAVIYKIDNEKKSAYATAYAGIGEDQKVFPSVIDIKNPAEGTYNFYTAYKENQLVLSENNGRRKNLPTGFWDKEAAQFIHIPVTGPGKSYPYAVISAALNPYRKFDDTYRQFCELIGERVSLEVNKMLALEEERKRAEALAEIDKAKTVFFSNISHEFRTPLTLMLSPLEELLKQRQSNLTKEEKQNIETAHRNSLRLLKLVNALLDFSRLESGRQQAAFSLTDIAALTKNLAANFRSVIEKAGLQLEVHTDENMLPVYADKQMWEKIVFNLLSNAFKYTLKGKITVEVSSEKNFAVLKVKDTGVGIPEKELPLMFERFHRVPQGAARTYEGTGIGLSLTKELVQMHGGSIAVESKLNEGSTFIIKIPFGKEHLLPKHIMADEKDSDDTAADIYIEEAETLFEINEDDKAPVTAENKNLPYILVADDNADMREHIGSLLSKQFNIITAKNGSDALGKIKERKPDLIVSDIMMPVMDGIELLKQIKSNKLTAHIPVILLTARAGEESKIEGWETGADDYLVKPFSGKELAARIKAHITLKQKTQAELKKIYQLFDDVPFAIAVLKDKDLVIDFINKYNLEIWGVKKENVLGKPLFEARPDIKENVEEIHNTVYKTGERFFAEEIPVEINNKTRYFDAIIDPMRDEAGNMMGQIATSIEVTEKAEARKKIEESEKKFRALAEATSAMVWTTTADGKFSTLQPSWEKYTGQSWDEYKEWGWANAIHPDDREFVERLWKEALAEKRNYHSWGRLWSARHQAWRYYDGKAIPLKDDNGEILEWIGIVYDVHEQEMARRKIETNEKELQSLVMQAPVAIVLVEGENLVAKVANTRALELMGKTEAEVLNKQMEEYFPELPERKNIYRQVFKTGIPYSGTEVEVSFNKNGKPYTGYFDLNYTPWFGTDGKIKGVMSIGAEVTEKVLARRKVEENFIENSRLAAIVQSSEDAIISKTLEGIVTSWNPGAEKLFGYSAEEMIGQSITKIIPVDRLQEEPDILNRIQQGENIDHFQTQRIDKKGNLIDISLAISPIKNNEGKIVGASKIARNITAEKRAEEKVKASEKKLLNIFSQTPAAIAVLEGPEHRFVLANTAAQKMVNRSQEELLGKTVKEIFPELEGQGIVEVFDHVFATGQITLLQEVPILVDLLNEGIVRQHYFNLSTEPVRDSEGEIQSVAVVAFDVTEMAEARKKIEESEKHLELVSNTVPALIFYLDKEHHYVTVNNAFTEWFG